MFNKKLGRQTGLPRDVTHSDMRPSQSIGFTDNTPQPAGNNVAAVANGVTYRFTSSTYNSQAIAQKILGASNRRKYLLLQNNGTVDIFVGFGATPSLLNTNALKLPPNSGISFDNGICPNNDVYVISSVQCLITVVEGLL